MEQYSVENRCREYKYDNIKFILIFLVVFGHIIENVEKLNVIYLCIYSFHMPVFAFVSGYFSKGNKKSIIKPIIIYIIFQTIYFLIFKFVLYEDVTLNYLYPIWILWYIFALGIWNAIAFVLRKINIKKNVYCYIIILIFFLIQLICGYINSNEYFLSVSRTITFLPFFVLGYFYKNNNIKTLKVDKADIITKCIIYLYIPVIYFATIPNMNRIWLWGTYSYKNGGYNIIFKLIFDLFNIVTIFIFNKFISNKKLLISSVGKNTLYIYLLHGIIIKLFNSHIDNILSANNVIFSTMIAILLTVIMIIRNSHYSIICE